MSVKLDIWNDPVKAKQLLARRLRAAKADRKAKVEPEWQVSRSTVFGDEFQDTAFMQSLDGVDTEDFDITDRIDVKYAFRNLRLVHSHMSSNPPVAEARPQTSDVAHRRAAKAADQAMTWMRTQYDLQEVNDLINLDCLVDGTGISYTGWNPLLGEVQEFDEETGEVTMTGDMEVRRVAPDDFWIDPDATCQRDIKWVIERRKFTEEQVRSHPKWAEHWRAIRRESKDGRVPEGQPLQLDDAQKNEDQEHLYDLYFYWEPGRPENGMLGRFVVCLESGYLVEGPLVNPNLAYPPPSLKEQRAANQKKQYPKRRPPTAYMPFQILTDVDIPGRVWGRSALFYVAPAQRLMTNLDSAMLEAIRAHGVVRMIKPPGMELNRESVANTSIEILEIEADPDNQYSEIKYMEPFGLPQAMPELRQLMRQGIDDMWGVNENMFGNQSREQSGAQMQYAVNQGVMVRRRLFNKSIRFVQQQYQALLSLAIQHWDVPHAIEIVGAENAYDVVEMLGMDLYCGYTIEVEYGTHLPLDPVSRRDDLLKYLPIYEKAGVSERSLASALKMDDLEYVQSVGDLARDRAKEVIDEIVESGAQVGISSKYQDHEGYLAYFMEYVNTADFERLEPKLKLLIDDHIQSRIQAAAQERTQVGGATGGNLGGAPSAPTGGPASPGPVGPGPGAAMSQLPTGTGPAPSSTPTPPPAQQQAS